MTDKTAIRPASTIIILRDRATSPRVLMGQRGAGAAFFPSKFVFPGGAVDAVDGEVPVSRPMPADMSSYLAESSALSPLSLAAAAIRELWEETGLILGQPGIWTDPPRGWRGFAAAGYLPDPAALRFVFRAVTPRGRPRRFDARFFLADVDALASDPDDFSRAEDELSHLQWVPLAEARTFDLPFITEVVLAEVQRAVTAGASSAGVPYYRNDEEGRMVTWLTGQSAETTGQQGPGA